MSKARKTTNTDVVPLVNWEDCKSPYYTDKHRRWRACMKSFVDTHILPNIDKWEKKGKVPDDFAQLAYANGVYTFGYPSELGGQPFEGEYDMFYLIIWYEQIARVGSGGIMTGIWTHSIAVPPIIHHGTQFQKELFRDVIMAKKASALAISEPTAGSDVRNIKTTARREGDYYIVNGEKYWISGGMRADYFVSAVRTGGPGINGISMLIIPRVQGQVFTTKLPLQGHGCSDTAYVVFRNAKVPVTYLVGKENEGFKVIMTNFNQERFGIAAGAVCMARTCLDESVRYAQSRKTFGKPLISHQVIRHKCAEMARLIWSAWTYMEKIAYQMQYHPRDRWLPRDIALFKVHATKVLEFCARESSQIFGGRSYVRGGRAGKIDRIYRDVRAYAIYGGSEEIMLDLAMRQAKL